MIKKYNQFIIESKKDIDAICKKWGIKNYTINPYGAVDVEGNVDLDDKRLTKLPIKFGRVNGGFFCGYNRLKTLEGAPNYVGDNFNCSDNELVTLEGSPSHVGGFFYCASNQLTTLEGSPSHVDGEFDCRYNQLTTLEGAPSHVDGNFYCSSNQIMNFRGFPEFFENDIILFGNPIEEIYNLFKNIKCIYWINEFDVIDGNTVIEDRLIEVYNQLGITPPKRIELKNYKLI